MRRFAIIVNDLKLSNWTQAIVRPKTEDHSASTSNTKGRGNFTNLVPVDTDESKIVNHTIELEPLEK